MERIPDFESLNVNRQYKKFYSVFQRTKYEFILKLSFRRK